MFSSTFDLFSVYFCIIILTLYICLAAVLSSVGGLKVGVDAIKQGITLAYKCTLLSVICNQGWPKARALGLTHDSKKAQLQALSPKANASQNLL